MQIAGKPCLAVAKSLVSIMALKSVLGSLVSDLTGHSHATCLADDHHGHALAPMASSFTAFFPDAAHHSDHFLPSIAPETVQGDTAHLDQFDQSLMARRPKMAVSFHHEE